MTVAIGIDIGLTGAIGFLFPDGAATVQDLPILDTDPKRIDAGKLLLLVREVIPEGSSAVAAIEDIRVRRMGDRFTSHSSEHSLALSRGIVQAVLDVAGVRTELVQPLEWKRFYGLIGEEKDESRQKALHLYPDLAALLQRKKDHNRAEALLITRFVQRRRIKPEDLAA